MSKIDSTRYDNGSHFDRIPAGPAQLRRAPGLDAARPAIRREPGPSAETQVDSRGVEKTDSGPRAAGPLRSAAAPADPIRREGPADRPASRLTLRLGEVATSLGVSRRALERERSAGRFPRADLTIGRMPLWRPETVLTWVEGGGRG